MERRTALALAVAAAGTVLASSAAFAINIGLLRHEADKPVGILDSSVIDASFGIDPAQTTRAIDNPGSGVGAVNRADLDGSNQPGTTSVAGHDGATPDGRRGSDDRSSSSTVPGHDDDD